MTNSDSHDATVLYVDDEDMARKYFELSFGAGYRVLTAASVEAAMAILNKGGDVDIVVTDYRMPGKNGGELLRQIGESFPHLVRIVVTAYADRETLLDTVNSGEVFRIIEKPLDLRQVSSALKQATDVLHKRNARRQRLMAIDETLAFLAHELNTPLAAILNFSRGVQRRLSDASVSPQQQAEIWKATLAMDDNARYCLALLASFVETIKGAGTLSPPRAEATAHQLVLSLLDTYPLTAAQRSMIQIDVQQDFPIEALPNCVSLVLSSLLSNSLRALKDWPAPSICFTVTGGEIPNIRITDNGPGIPMEVQDRLMVDPVTTHAGSGGHGWGMIFCKRIMQSFGGSILVRSLPGAYTAITLNFPAVKAVGAHQ